MDAYFQKLRPQPRLCWGRLIVRLLQTRFHIEMGCQQSRDWGWTEPRWCEHGASSLLFNPGRGLPPFCGEVFSDPLPSVRLFVPFSWTPLYKHSSTVKFVCGGPYTKSVNQKLLSSPKPNDSTRLQFSTSATQPGINGWSVFWSPYIHAPNNNKKRQNDKPLVLLSPQESPNPLIVLDFYNIVWNKRAISQGLDTFSVQQVTANNTDLLIRGFALY